MQWSCDLSTLLMYHNLVLPGGRFFEPQESFWEQLAQYKDRRIFDCGTGCGSLPKEARERGFDMIGIDLLDRDGQDPDVVRLDARVMPFQPTDVVIVCRPDHSGWIVDLLERALHKTGMFIYIGLDKNFDTDLWEYANEFDTIIEEIGMDGEKMLTYFRSE